MTVLTDTITSYFGVFGERDYEAAFVERLDDHAVRVPCRWCVGDDDPDRDCVCCKNTRRMWVGL